MLKLWGRRNSINVQKVLWLIGELGIDYEHFPAGGDFGGLDEPQFRALNPHRRVPVIEDGRITVWESHSILRYLAARYARAGFWPGLATRARIEPWMDWEQTTFQPAFAGGLLWGYFRTPEAQRDWPAIREAEAACAEHLTLIDHILAGRPFLASDRLTLADIPLGTMLYRYFEMDVMHPDIPNVRRWYQKLASRAPYRDHVMVPFDELRGRRAF